MQNSFEEKHNVQSEGHCYLVSAKRLKELVKAKLDNAPLKSPALTKRFPCDKSWSHTSLQYFFPNILKFMRVEYGPII